MLSVSSGMALGKEGPNLVCEKPCPKGPCNQSSGTSALGKSTVIIVRVLGKYLIMYLDP